MAGAVSGASLNEYPGDTEDYLEHPVVQKLIDQIPELELYRHSATVLGSEGSLLRVPANYGKLVVKVPNSVGPDDEFAASFYFDEWVSGVDRAWPQGTTARLTATKNDLLFERGATDREKDQLLRSLTGANLEPENTKILLAPNRGS